MGERDRLSYSALGQGAIVPAIAVFAWQRIPRDENGEIAVSYFPGWFEQGCQGKTGEG